MFNKSQHAHVQVCLRILNFSCGANFELCHARLRAHTPAPGAKGTTKGGLTFILYFCVESRNLTCDLALRKAEDKVGKS